MNSEIDDKYIHCFGCPYIRTSNKAKGIDNEQFYWCIKDSLPGAGYEGVAEYQSRVVFKKSALKIFWQNNKTCVYWREFHFDKWIGRIIPITISIIALIFSGITLYDRVNIKEIKQLEKIENNEKKPPLKSNNNVP